MKPASLLGVLLELLEELDRPGPYPADARVGKFFRARRYLGARDRRTISAGAYGWLRHRLRGEARWDAWAAGAGLPARGDLPEKEGRIAVLLALARDGLLPWTSEELLGAVRGLPPSALAGWEAVLEAAARPDAIPPSAWPAEPAARLAAELSLPAWMAARLVEERGEEAARLLGAALLVEPPVDLRVNISRTTRDAARVALARAIDEDLSAILLTPWSPLGLRLAGRRSLDRFHSLHPGWVEVQDEGSQAVVLSAAAVPPATVIDACAGAGGKTLALLDLRDAGHGTGVIHACDIHAAKLEELRRRAHLAGARSLHLHAIAPEGPLPPSLPEGADLVIIDAPCTGSGTLRRSPDLKHRFGPEDLERFAALQGSILRRFAACVRPGGALVYSTCSLFHEENGAVVESFLAERREFREVPSTWAEAHLPPAARRGPRLHLDPVSSGTDGLFAAFLHRKA